MKATIEKKFVDKHTGKLYKVGEVVDFTKERIEEICEKDASLIKVSRTKAAPARKKAVKEDE